MKFSRYSLSAGARRIAAGAALCARTGGALALGAGLVAALPLAPALVAPAQAAPNPNTYVLGPGDALGVVVQGYPEFNQTNVVIPPDGTVTLPSYGTLKLSGKTRLQAQSALAAALKSTVGMRRPVVAVAITTFRTGVVGSVVLSGDVPRPGSVELREGGRLSEVLANAGMQDRLEEKRATLLRKGQSIPLDLRAAVASPRGPADIALRAGDVISVRTVAPGRVTVRGPVRRPGTYELHRDPRAGAMEVGLKPRVSDLIDAAGGLPANAGDAATGTDAASAGGAATAGGGAVGLSKTNYTATLLRSGQSRAIDVAAALGGDAGANPTLAPGDVVTVSTVEPIKVYIAGLAQRTGEFDVAPGTGLLQLLTSAGGLTAKPDEVVGSIQRGARSIPLDMKALMLSSNSASNVKLQDGDIVQLRSPATVNVRVAGAVKEPGEVSLKPGGTVLEAILGAGGLTSNAEDVRLNVLRKEPDGTQRVMNANAAGILSVSDISTNYTLQEGDLVNVTPVQTQTVIVSGEVTNPGPYQLRQGEGLAELITRAGGAKDDALLTGVTVKRDDKQLDVNAYEAVKNGKPGNFDLADGDFVFVPMNPQKILIMEGVQKPGYYPIPERGQLTLTDALGQAQPVANTKKVLIYRAREDGTVDRDQKPREISLDKVRRGTEGNIVLQPRDILFVPSPRTGSRGLASVLPLVGLARLFF